jgi:zinc/manganese transport system substrate-binding protein
MPILAKTVATLLARRDPANRAGYEQRLAAFESSLKPLTDKIAALKQVYAGAPVTATEPVFGYMAAAIGLDMRNEGFQLAIMNGTEPSPSQIAAFQRDLRNRGVRVLLYNSQTSQDLTERMRRIAKESGLPVVGVSETEPANLRFQDWMLSQLEALETGLLRSRP